MNINKIKVLNGNVLKILAAIFMVIDHVGLMFFPYEPIFRIIGRLAFPIFAFMISEGARYTKNKTKYLLMISGLALICQLVYFFFANSLYMCILVTFSLSIIVIYAMNDFKKHLFSPDSRLSQKIVSGMLFALSVLAVSVANRFLDIDYGFWGCMTPVFASLFDFRGVELPDEVRRVDCIPVRVLAMSIPLLVFSKGIQYYCLFALLLLLCYSGKRGRAHMKYFFYLFYPLHLVALTAIQVVLMLIK